MNTGETSLVGEEVRILAGECSRCRAEVVGLTIAKFRCVVLFLEGPRKGHLEYFDNSVHYIFTKIADPGDSFLEV